ncbi:amidase [Variovorax sp. LjRoot84]|uniref:amidase n=1 Tax=Variovorax sp. LjRoot84 TaxID=3342340 RepID=UPI003ECE7CD1
MNYSAIVEIPAAELRRLIGTRQLSPVELLEACIARIEATNPLVNAITATCFDRAREEARLAESAVMRGASLGLLHGLPFAVKDLEDTAGVLSTMGTPSLRDNVPAHDVELVRRLRDAGAILVGKTNVPEMGAGANTRNPVWGATGNPFNPNLNAGGSSGGSAAALALDMLPICTGSDTGGSLRIPAACCGVVGFRPSPGLVPNARKLLGWSPISVAGPMGRTVAEACLQLAATAGHFAGDPLSYPADAVSFLNPRALDLSELRVGWTEDFGICDVDPAIRRTMRDRVSKMRGMVAECEEVSVSLGDVHRCFDVLRAEAFVAGTCAAYERDPDSLGPNPRTNYEMGMRMSLLESAWAHSEQTKIIKTFQGLFDRYDIILSPTTPVSPFPWTQLYADVIDGKPQENYYRWLALTYLITLTTHPAISLPCGVDEYEMPFGLQVVGGFRDDLRLLSTAHALECEFERHPSLTRPRPTISSTRRAVPALDSIVTAPPADRYRHVPNGAAGSSAVV